MKSRRRGWGRLLAVAMVLLAAAPVAGQTPVDVEALGPQVGAPVPDFSGVDQQGRRHTLKSLMGRGGLMLVFNRSADW